MLTIIHPNNTEMHEVKVVFSLPYLFLVLAILTATVKAPVNIFTFLWKYFCGVDS